ncbi:MAG: PilZ domain-containing protein [Thermodesulfobacteriota bacterium]
MTTEDSKSVLVACGGEFYNSGLGPILAEAGHSARLVRDKDELTAAFKGELAGLDLIIVDLDMPDIGGARVFAWFKKKGVLEKCPVLALIDADITARTLGQLKKLGAAGIISKTFTPEHIAYSIKRLLFQEKVEKRAAARVPVSIPSDFTIGDNRYTGTLLNISSTGVFLHSAAELLIGARLNLLFSLPGFNRVLNLKGVVMWSTRPSVGKSIFGGSGIMFTAVSGEDQLVLDDFIGMEVKRLGLEGDASR